MEVANNEKLNVLQKILDKKFVSKNRDYCIQLENTNMAQLTWEPSENLKILSQKVNQFNPQQTYIPIESQAQSQTHKLASSLPLEGNVDQKDVKDQTEKKKGRKRNNNKIIQKQKPRDSPNCHQIEKVKRGRKKKDNKHPEIIKQSSTIVINQVHEIHNSQLKINTDSININQEIGQGKIQVRKVIGLIREGTNYSLQVASGQLNQLTIHNYQEFKTKYPEKLLQFFESKV